MITPKMLNFISTNKSRAVIFGEKQTPEGGPVITKIDFDRSDRALYRLEGGLEFVLLSSDSHSAPDFLPRWLNEPHTL